MQPSAPIAIGIAIIVSLATACVTIAIIIARSRTKSSSIFVTVGAALFVKYSKHFLCICASAFGNKTP